jgi:di/tricarboxylate transporter
MDRSEKLTMVIFLMTLLLWATDSYHKVDSVIIGTVAVVAMMWPGFGPMTWKEAQSSVPWNVFVLYGAGLSMGTSLVTSGAAKWLAAIALGPITDMPIKMQLVALIWIATILQVLFTGGGPKTTALTPIILAHAIAIGADPYAMGLILGANMQHQYLLPVSNMPNAVAMGSGELLSSDLIKTGAVMSVLAAAWMSVMVYTYWTWMGIAG